MKRALFNFLFVFSSSVLSVGAQIDQTHPELCAKPGGAVPIPPNFSVTVDRSAGHADLFLGSGFSAIKVSIPSVVDEVQEVCPLPGGRLLVFGANYNDANLNIVDPTNATLLDSFEGFAPAMSPNQRWLAYRKFYPRHTEFDPSEEYLLYDLTKTAAQNRPPGVPTDDRDDVGVAIFPLVESSNAPFDNSWLPEVQQHGAGSDSFFWASDSQAVVFGDILQKLFSVVLVTIDESGATKAYVHPIKVSQTCPGKPDHLDSFGVFIAHADIGPAMEGDRLIHLSFRPTPGVCEPKEMELHSADFQPAKPEVHVRPKKLKAVEGPPL
jgi:hypothetical protein